jgi:hypothetical protein
MGVFALDGRPASLGSCRKDSLRHAGEKVTQPGTQAEGAKDRFGSDTPEIYILVSLQEIKTASQLKSSWICLDGIQIPSYEIDTTEAEFQKETGQVPLFSLFPDPKKAGLWDITRSISIWMAVSCSPCRSPLWLRPAHEGGSDASLSHKAVLGVLPFCLR